MDNGQHFKRFVLLVTIIAAMAIVPGCKRATDEAPVPTPVPDIPVAAIGFPQANPSVGVTITGAPTGLVATYNGERWIELVDEGRPNLHYTFTAGPDPEGQNHGVATVDEFLARVRSYRNGEVTGEGEIETPFGDSDWASGTYVMDGELLEEIFLLAPHPSGAGHLILTSLCPRDVASIDERLAVMQKLLSYVS